MNITRIASNNKFNLVAIGYSNGSIRLHGNIKNKHAVNPIEYTFSGHQHDRIICIVFDPKDEFIYASSEDKSYGVYSVKLLRCVRLYANYYDVRDFKYDYLDIVNICAHEHGLISCYLTASSMHFYTRYNYKSTKCKYYSLIW